MYVVKNKNKKDCFTYVRVIFHDRLSVFKYAANWCEDAGWRMTRLDK